MTVAVSLLRDADSPRLGGIDLEHVQTLAEVGEGLPPILVNRKTMRVIDGMHRLNAARMRAQDEIEVQFFDGSDEEAFLRAVEANVSHGLPLTLAERRAAAERIIRSHPLLSDRAIAAAAGLAAKTVAAIRRSTAEVPQSHARLGRDGRIRPLNSAEGRRLASEMIAANPTAPLRLVAKESGISVGTARDVRKRVAAGENPVPLQQRGGARRNVVRHGKAANSRTPGSPPAEAVDSRAMLENLRRDPSLRYTDAGRSLLRWLSLRTITVYEWRSVVGGLPPHSTVLLSRLARACAHAWREFADELDRTSECA